MCGLDAPACSHNVARFVRRLDCSRQCNVLGSVKLGRMVGIARNTRHFNSFYIQEVNRLSVSSSLSERAFFDAIPTDF